MDRTTPTTIFEAEKQLLQEYHRVKGMPACEMAAMICKVSAERIMSGISWEWIKDDSNPNWGMQLHFGERQITP